MKTIYRNIQYKPRIWGLYFTSLFSALGIFLAVLMVLSLTMNVAIALFLSLLFLGVIYGYSYFRDNRDEVEYRAKRSGLIKDCVSSYTVSHQKFKLDEYDK